jgi:hypothetical protein
MSNRESTTANVEVRLARAQKTTDEARAVIDAERNALRAKTAQLRAQRLAKGAAEGASMPDKKPVKRKRQKA